MVGAYVALSAYGSTIEVDIVGGQVPLHPWHLQLKLH